MESYPFLFAALHFMLLLFPSSSLPHDNFTDLSALLAFKARVGDPDNILSTNWTTNASFCSWTGVRCSHRRQRVVSLRLRDVPLHGTIAPEVANLSFLSRLILSNNSLVGHIPASLSRLPRLKILALQINQLSGPIPPAIFNMSLLTHLYLIENNLSGSLPSNASFHSMLPRIQNLSLAKNQLSGNIPSSLYFCDHLRALFLSFNQFTGNIPSELGILQQLQILYLGENILTGTIPPSLGNLTNLLELTLGDNNLNGVIPKEMGGLLNLQKWLLSNNHGITGPIPTSLSNISSLQAISLSSNKLVGPIRVDFKSMRHLHRLFFGNNKLNGGLDFLESLSNCRDLQMLGFEKNEFHGSLPNTIGNLSRRLYFFSVYNNHIEGKIPAELGNLSSLRILDLGDNELAEKIPSELTMLESIQWINLSKNKICGSIPFELGRLSILSRIYFEENKLSGFIPESVGNISALQILYLNYNALSSGIPQSMWNLTRLFELGLSQNFLTGSLSASVGNIKFVVHLDMSRNQLSGELPSALKELQMLTYLDLSNNAFDGQIPQSFGGLISVKVLDLSCNNLSGVIPESLVSLRYLNNINLSFNRLEGKIPRSGVFLNLTNTSLMGNAALCGAIMLGFPPCSTNVKVSSRVHFLYYVLPVTTISIILFTCLGIFLWKSRPKQPKNSPTGNTPYINDYRLISYHEIARATENFNEANLLGRGSFGSVYKGCLDDGMLVVIKILNLEDDGALRSFDVECNALRMVRHRNLVKIINICSNLDFRALILQFMPNGSLEKWLYSHNYCLNPLQRIGITLDVALALEYLHHHSSKVIVHCDLKPSNVLLDDDMKASVSDFGIAKILLDDSRTATSTIIAGTIGYMAPEYASTGRVSRKGDVYSFGILLLEIFMRKKPTDPMFAESGMCQWVSQTYPVGLFDIVDCNLLKDEQGNKMSSEDLLSMHACLSAIMELGIICSNTSPSGRPDMMDVVTKLQKIKRDLSSMFPVALKHGNVGSSYLQS